MIYILVITLILIIIYLLYVSPEQTETEIKNIKAINDYRARNGLEVIPMEEHSDEDLHAQVHGEE